MRVHRKDCSVDLFVKMKLLLLFITVFLYILNQNLINCRSINEDIDSMDLLVNAEVSRNIPDDPLVKFYENLIAENERIPRAYVQFARRSKRRSRRSWRRFIRTSSTTASTATTTTTTTTTTPTTTAASG